MDHLPAPIVLNDPTQSVPDEPGPDLVHDSCRALAPRRPAGRTVQGVHLPEYLGPKDLTAVVATFSQLEPDPLSHVRRGAVDAAGRIGQAVGIELPLHRLEL